MDITLDWLGCATFRLTIDDTVIFLDAYMDRVPAAPPVGLRAAEVEKADFVLVGHAHFDHIAGAEVIAKNTGARIIGSHESCRVMREQGVPGGQLLPSQGGERYGCKDATCGCSVPALCTWSTGGLRARKWRPGTWAVRDERAGWAPWVGWARDRCRSSPATNWRCSCVYTWRGRSGAATDGPL